MVEENWWSKVGEGEVSCRIQGVFPPEGAQARRRAQV